MRARPTNVYAIGLAIVLANRVSPILAIIARDLLKPPRWRSRKKR